MGLNRPLHSMENFMVASVAIYRKFVEWKKRNGDELFIFCKYPEIVHLVRWKYDYLLFKKNIFRCCCNTIEKRELIKTNLCIEIPKGYYESVVRRSGLVNLKGLFAFNGTVNAEYKGNVCVVLFNLSNFNYVVEIGNWIGQFIVEKRNDIKFVEYNYLPDSDRSNNGFGSTLGFKQLLLF